jgi:hypothetical protein
MQAVHEKAGGQLDQIEAFAAIAEHGGFAAAARVLGKDPSVCPAGSMRWNGGWACASSRGRPAKSA